MTDLLELAFIQSKDAIVLCNEHATVVKFNKEAEQLLENMVTKVAEIDLCSNDVIKYKGDGVTPYQIDELPMRQALQGNVFTDHEMMISYGGRKDPIFLSISGGPIKSGSQIVGGMISFRPMNNRNNEKFDLEVLSAELQEKNDKLEQAEKDLRNLAEKIKSTNKALSASNQELSNFAMRVAHDLKTPLTPISGFIEILIEELSQKLNPEQTQFFYNILDSCKNMRKLIDDLLEYSKFDPNKIRVKDINLEEIFKDVFNTLDASMKQINCTYEVSSLPIIKADPVPSRHLFQNIIGNSLKYRKAEVPLKIKVSYNREKSEISIKDNGLGFNEKDALSIFSPLKRLGNSKAEGHGLGLAMCQNIAHSQGWEIRAQGVVNEGAEFIIQLNKDKK